MEDQTLLPTLFRTEYGNIVSVLSFSFGIRHIEIAEDIVSETFLAATEVWSVKGTPDNPRAWLYAVAKNKTRNYVRRNSRFDNTVAKEILASAETSEEYELDLSVKNIDDSQLAMIFTVCNPINSTEAQIAMALNLLCGFGIQEIADAFLTNKEVVYRRISRAKERLKEADIVIREPCVEEIAERLPSVLMTIYLMFSEGYYSRSQNRILRKDFCEEAMRLCMLLIDKANTDTPEVKALYSLMCFHTSRFDARENEQGETILYDDQDDARWNQELITRGTYFLNFASVGDRVSRFHLEAGIAFWHTQKVDTLEKWINILDLYNHLLIIEYSPVAALNRTFVLSKTHGKLAAIEQAEKLKLIENPYYHSLLGNLYTGIDNAIAIVHYQTSITLTSSPANRAILIRKIEMLR